MIESQPSTARISNLPSVASDGKMRFRKEDLESRWKTFCASDRQFQTDATTAAADTAAIVKMLDAFCPLNSVPAGGSESPAAAVSRLKQSAGYQDTGIRAAVDPVVQRCSQLADIDAAPNSTALLKSRDDNAPVEQQLARWRKLGSFADADFPATAQLAQVLQKKGRFKPRR